MSRLVFFPMDDLKDINDFFGNQTERESTYLDQKMTKVCKNIHDKEYRDITKIFSVRVHISLINGNSDSFYQDCYK